MCVCHSDEAQLRSYINGNGVLTQSMSLLVENCPRYIYRQTFYLISSSSKSSSISTRGQRPREPSGRLRLPDGELQDHRVVRDDPVPG